MSGHMLQRQIRVCLKWLCDVQYSMATAQYSHVVWEEDTNIGNPYTVWMTIMLLEKNDTVGNQGPISLCLSWYYELQAPIEWCA